MDCVIVIFIIIIATEYHHLLGVVQCRVNSPAGESQSHSLRQVLTDSLNNYSNLFDDVVCFDVRIE